MEKASQPQRSTNSRILYNCYNDGDIEGEAFVSDHIFSFIVSGTHDIWIGNEFYTFKAGDYRFFRRNQLTKYIKRPADGGFKSITIHIDQDTLQQISRQYNLPSGTSYPAANVLLLKPNRYFDKFIDSLQPYINTLGDMHENIKQLKVTELVLLLLDTNPALKDVLFDFSAPGKIDLEAFMNQHYRYNVSIDRFAYLTGRSLSGFKRDFAQLFNTTPSRWLTHKRLEEAHYLLHEKGRKPSDIYLDIGFTDLSHFSHAYKKAFGMAPTKGR